MTPQPQQPHVRWFGRSEDDPNRLLIIEDEHSRVFLDYPLREELYAAIARSRPAPSPEPTIPERQALQDASIKYCKECEAFHRSDAVTKARPKIQKQAAAQAREKVLKELKADLQTRFVSSSNQWSKGRNSGLLECCNIIDESLRTGGEPR